MNFNSHYDLVNAHAILSPSQSSWVNYTEEKLDERFFTIMAAARGTRLHEFAKEAIELGVRLENNGETVNAYVNDAIEFGMTPEQILFYSKNCFGTADAISFTANHLQIHDLKTGVHEAPFRQLEVYASIFCLEYDLDPYDISMELRIYQNHEVRIFDSVRAADIVKIMDTIVQHDRRIELLKTQM